MLVKDIVMLDRDFREFIEMGVSYYINEDLLLYVIELISECGYTLLVKEDKDSYNKCIVILNKDLDAVANYTTYDCANLYRHMIEFIIEKASEIIKDTFFNLYFGANMSINSNEGLSKIQRLQVIIKAIIDNLSANGLELIDVGEYEAYLNLLLNKKDWQLKVKSMR